jgi:hypothetical protein
LDNNQKGNQRSFRFSLCFSAFLRLISMERFMASNSKFRWKVFQHVAASTQRQALNAIVFLYRRVLDRPIEGQLEQMRARRRPSPPVVMTMAEVQRVLGQMQGTHLFMAKMF